MTIKLQHYARAIQSILLQAGISKDKVIPLYGRGNTDGKDPRYQMINENSVDNLCAGKRCLQDLRARGQSQLQTTRSQVLVSPPSIYKTLSDSMFCCKSSMNALF